MKCQRVTVVNESRERKWGQRGKVEKENEVRKWREILELKKSYLFWHHGVHYILPTNPGNSSWQTI